MFWEEESIDTTERKDPESAYTQYAPLKKIRRMSQMKEVFILMLMKTNPADTLILKFDAVKITEAQKAYLSSHMNERIELFGLDLSAESVGLRSLIYDALDRVACHMPLPEGETVFHVTTGRNETDMVLKENECATFVGYYLMGN